MARFGAAGAKAILLLSFAAHCHLARAECGESEVCESEMAAPSGGDALLAKRIKKLGATVAAEEEAEAEQQHGEAAKAARLERRRRRTERATEAPQSTWLTMSDMDYRKSDTPYTLEKAFDGNTTTHGTALVFVADFGTRYVISKIQAIWRYCNECNETGALLFSVSEDGEKWTEFHSPQTYVPSAGYVDETYAVEASGRYFRIEVTRDVKWVSFWELGFYGYLDPKSANVYNWFHSYRAGEDYLEGTEILHLTPYQGKLFGGTGYWKHTGAWRGAEVVRLDCEFCDWAIETRVGEWAGRVESLQAIEWTTDASGQVIAHGPIPKLVAGWYMDWGGIAKCFYNVRVDDMQIWKSEAYWEKTPYKDNYYSARAMVLYQDPITKVDHLFATTGMDGIIAGVFCQECETTVRFPDHTESGPVGTRPLGIAVHDGNIYFSASSYIKRRVNGNDPHWITVFDMAEQDSSTTVDEAVGGIRGLTSIAHAASPTGRSLLFSWSPNEQSAGCMIRLDPTGDDHLGLVAEWEQCTRDVSKAYLGKNVDGKEAMVTFVISDYNKVMEVNDEEHGTVHLIGYEILLYSYSASDFAVDPNQVTTWGGKKIAFYVGAGYMIRRGPADYQAREPRGPRYDPLDIYPKLTAVRTLAKSPWDDAIYMGGYDCNHYDSANTAWVFRGEKSAVFAEDVPCQKELGCGHVPGATFDESSIGCDWCQGREFLGRVAAYWWYGVAVSCQSSLDWLNTQDDNMCATLQEHDLARECCGGCDFCLGTGKSFDGSALASTPEEEHVYSCDVAHQYTLNGGMTCLMATGIWSERCCN